MKRSQCKSDRHARVIEPLERRVHLDGHVAAFIQSGDLVIRGDEEDNSVVVSRANANSIRLEGRDDTLINGRSSVTLRRFPDDLKIQMNQGGEDVVSVQGPFHVPDAVQAEIGAGELLIEGSLGRVTVGGDVLAKAGEDAVVNLRNEMTVDGELNVESDGAANVVSSRTAIPDYSAARFSDSLSINNPYFPLVPGTTYTYDVQGIDDDTDEPFTERIVVEVTNQTKTILGVQTRVVRDRVFDEDDLLIEDTFDWYAQDDNGNVWYFGEDTTEFEYDDEGNLIGSSTEGAWIAGVDDAQAGVVMEARPRVGHWYYQEFAPGNVLDAAAGVSLSATRRVPVGKYRNVFRTEEYTVVEPEALANKLYAPGVGTIMEFDYDLEDHEVIQTTRLVGLTLNGRAVREVVSPTGFAGTNAGTSRLIDEAIIGGDACIEAGDAVVLNNAILERELEVEAEAEVFVVNSELSKYAEFAGEAVTFRSVFADDTVRVGGASDVQIFDSQIDRLLGRFSGAGNDLVVTNSLFDEFDVDGGGGNNEFTDQGGNSFLTQRIRRFT